MLFFLFYSWHMLLTHQFILLLFLSEDTSEINLNMLLAFWTGAETIPPLGFHKKLEICWRSCSVASCTYLWSFIGNIQRRNPWRISQENGVSNHLWWGIPSCLRKGILFNDIYPVSVLKVFIHFLFKLKKWQW